MLEAFADLWPAVLSLLHLTAALAVTVHAVLGRRDVPAVIGWVGLAWLAPVVGSLLYLAFGINRIQRAALELQYPPIVVRPGVASGGSAVTRRDGAAALAQWANRPGLHGLMHLGASVTGRPLQTGNAIRPLVDGDEAYPAMLEAIAGATTSIALMSYIFDADRVGRKFLDALSAAQGRGVAVRVLVDDVGARYSRPGMPTLLEHAGVRAATFLPTRTPRLFRYANLRNHRKVLVVDGRIGFTGGMNIREGHQLSLHPASPIRCLHFQVAGPIVAELQRVFQTDWAFATGESLTDAVWQCSAEPVGEVVARGIPDGPDADLENMPEMLLGALSVARERVRIVTPYFLPDARIRSALRVAAMRGVAVDVIVPARNNIPLMDWAIMPQMLELIEAGCHVWLSPAPFDHTKLFVVDGAWSLIGSTNWDARSLRLNFEYNLECYDAGLAARLDALAESRIVSSHRLDLDGLMRRPVLVQLRDGVARLLSPYL